MKNSNYVLENEVIVSEEELALQRSFWRREYRLLETPILKKVIRELHDLCKGKNDFVENLLKMKAAIKAAEERGIIVDSNLYEF